MTARLALSSGTRTAQYVGTTKVNSPSPIPGSAFARRFNGTSDRVVLSPSSEIGVNFMLSLVAWKASTVSLPDNDVSHRLFTQFAVGGGTRIAVGFNGRKLALFYTTAVGTEVMVESAVDVLTTDRLHIVLEVKSGAIKVLLNGRKAIELTTSLASPGPANALLGSDAGSRFFSGTLDEVALFQAWPARIESWTRYWLSLVAGRQGRDYIAAGLANPQAGAVILADDAGAQGSEELSRATLSAPFSNHATIGEQIVEFSMGTATDEFRIGVFNETFSTISNLIGEAPGSVAYLSTGRLLVDGVQDGQSYPPLLDTQELAITFNPTSGLLRFHVNGVETVSKTLTAGTWTAAAIFGRRGMTVNTGNLPQGVGLPAAAPTASRWWSKLSTELRNMKAGNMVSALDDLGSDIVDAYSGATIGLYTSPVPLEAGFTGDPYDYSRRVGGGIKVLAAPAAGADFFFGLAFSPEASDLIGTKTLLECPGKWAMKLLDGRLNCSVGAVQVGSTEVAFEAGKRYLVAMTRSPGGTLLVWTHVGYVLQSGDVTSLQTSGDVWVGSAAGGATEQFAGRLSHLILSGGSMDKWKRDRLAATNAWDTMVLAGQLPTPVSNASAFELSYWDVVQFGLDAEQDVNECYAGVVAAKPDEVSVEYRLVQRLGDLGGFSGAEIEDWAVTGILSTELSADPTDTVMTFGTGGLPGIETITIGSPALIGDEICKVTGTSPAAGTVTVARACVDTIPARHSIGARVWFYGAHLGANAVAYGLGQTVQMRLLSRSALVEITEDMAPTLQVTMAQRAARPYPPAGLRVNGVFTPGAVYGTCEVTWKHRNKVGQAASLRSWDEPSVAAPTGLTYIVRAYDASNSTLLFESTSLLSTTGNYDLYVEGFVGEMLITVTSYQGGMQCLRVPSLQIEYNWDVMAYVAAEDGSALVPETGEDAVIQTEPITTLLAGSFDGTLPDNFSGLVEEEEEEEELTAEGGEALVGVRISDMPNHSSSLSGAELIPIVKDGQNFHVTPAQLLSYLTPLLPEAADGDSAYEIAVANGFVGSQAAWLASLQGPQGPSTNASRRILTIGAASGAIACNWSLYDEIRITLAGNATLTFAGARDGQGCLLKLRQDATGGRQVTFASTIRYNALLQSYQVSQAPGLVDKVGFVYDSAESVYDLVSLVPGLTT